MTRFMEQELELEFLGLGGMLLRDPEPLFPHLQSRTVPCPCPLPGLAGRTSAHTLHCSRQGTQGCHQPSRDGKRDPIPCWKFLSRSTQGKLPLPC